MSISQGTPDVEAVFHFNGVKRSPVTSGYRPAHQVTEEYLTTGEHCYFDKKLVYPNDTVRGTIAFLSPEAYPHCLWIGKKIQIQEGERVVGSATVTRILNPLLEKGESM